jgi:hypothetical protein
MCVLFALSSSFFLFSFFFCFAEHRRIFASGQPGFMVFFNFLIFEVNISILNYVCPLKLDKKSCIAHFEYIRWKARAKFVPALPETRPLPSVHGFAECKISGTRQRASLPSAALRKRKHTVNSFFAECHRLDKEKHSAKNLSA